MTSQPLSHGRRRWIAVLLAIAIITGFGAIFATWVKRQALDSGNWTNTSAKLLANPTIRQATGDYLANELFNSVDVQGRLREALPAQTQGLAGPAAAGLRELAARAAPELLARPRVQDVWISANKGAHQQLMNILNGGGEVVQTQQGEVTLNLHSLVNQLAAQLGVEDKVSQARQKVPVPASAGELTIMKSEDLQTAQDVAKAIKGVSIVLTIVSLGLFALVVWLGRGDRRLYLRRVGWSFVGLGLFSLLIRRVTGNRIVDGLVQAESVKPAAHDAWMIATSLLYTIAISMVVYGLLIVLSAWLAGETRSAAALRRAMAPAFRDHVARVYVTAGVLYLLVLAWGPTPAFRNFIPIVLIGALLVLGIETIRRQSVREFPQAAHGDATRAIRGWLSEHLGRGRKVAPPAPTPADGNGERLSELERLAALHDHGALTDEEFSSQKALVLGGH